MDPVPTIQSLLTRIVSAAKARREQAPGVFHDMWWDDAQPRETAAVLERIAEQLEDELPGYEDV